MVQAVQLGQVQDQLKSRKRTQREAEDVNSSDIDISSTDDEAGEKDSDDEDEDGNDNIVNIDFDFFNANKEVDFHALKTLLRQLFGKEESNKLQLSALADLVLDACATTTIKCEGKESDPYCFFSLIDYQENKNSDYVQYLHKVDMRLKTFFQTLESAGNKKAALVLSERFINMPPEIVPPLYRITLEDASNSLQASAATSQTSRDHYDFYVFVSRKYEINFDADEDVDVVDNNTKGKRTKKATQIDYFHPEDQFLEKYAKINFDGKSNKGIIPSYIIIDHAGLVKAIDDLDAAIATW